MTPYQERQYGELSHKYANSDREAILAAWALERGANTDKFDQFQKGQTTATRQLQQARDAVGQLAAALGMRVAL